MIRTICIAWCVAGCVASCVNHDALGVVLNTLGVYLWTAHNPKRVQS